MHNILPPVMKHGQWDHSERKAVSQFPYRREFSPLVLLGPGNYMVPCFYLSHGFCKSTNTSGEHHRVWKKTQCRLDMTWLYVSQIATCTLLWLSVHSWVYIATFLGPLYQSPDATPCFQGPSAVLFVSTCKAMARQYFAGWARRSADSMLWFRAVLAIKSGFCSRSRNVSRYKTSWSASCPTSTTHAGPIRCFLVSDFAGCSQDMTAATPLHRGKLRKWSWVTKCWDPGFDKSISTSQTVTNCQRVSYKYKYKFNYIIIIKKIRIVIITIIITHIYIYIYT